MLANQHLLIETIQATHRNTESVLTLVAKLAAKVSGDIENECQSLRDVLKDTDSMFTTLKSASTADLSEALKDVKKYASDVVASESSQMQTTLGQQVRKSEAELDERFKKLESRVLSELGGGSSDDGTTGGRKGGADPQLLKKVTNRLSDFEAQVSSQLQLMGQDMDKKLAFLGTQQRSAAGSGDASGLTTLTQEMNAVKYDVSELKDLVSGTKTDVAHVKRIVLACERDMEDFTAAMDAVNVDLDEMRARVDSTHSIITSRQRVEATVTAEISTMRLDMGDMQEALKAHDAWMEDVSQGLQEVHERCQQVGEDVSELREQTQSKLDGKVDLTAWNDMNDDFDASVKTVRDMASTLRLEVDSRRRKVDETFNQFRTDIQQLEFKVDGNQDQHSQQLEATNAALNARCDQVQSHARGLEDIANRHMEVHSEIHSKLDKHAGDFHSRHEKLEADLRKQDEDMHRAVHERMDSIEKAHTSGSKDISKRLNALDLRISGLQGASGEAKRDANKLRDEVNSLTVKSAAHDVDIGKSSDDLRRLERSRAEDNQRLKQDMDSIYEELDQKVYEKGFHGLEDNVTKLTRGVVKLCQVVGVFPGARMNDGTEEELDVDVELLNWEDCAQNLTTRVEKMWRQASSQKYRSILDLVSKKADHSVLRLLQISQQHIESQLDRVRHERELWKEVVDKRAQQPLQLALTLKDPHTGLPLPNHMQPGMNGGVAFQGLPPSAFTGPGQGLGFQQSQMSGGGMGGPGGGGMPMQNPTTSMTPRIPVQPQQDPLMQTLPTPSPPTSMVSVTEPSTGKAPTPLAKRLAKPSAPLPATGR